MRNSRQIHATNGSWPGFHRHCGRLVPLLLATILCLGGLAREGRAQPVRPGTEAYDTIAAAIAILRDYEENCDPPRAAGMPRVSIARCLQRILDNKNIILRNQPESGIASFADRSANCNGTDQIALNRILIADKSHLQFSALLATLYHEGTHALQDLSRVTTSNYHDVNTAPLEIQAYFHEARFAQRWKGGLAKLLANMRAGDPLDQDMDDCEKILLACYLDDPPAEDNVRALHWKACARMDRADAVARHLRVWLEKNLGSAPPAAAASSDRDGDRFSGAALEGGELHYAELAADSSLAAFETTLDTGLDEVVALLFRASAQSRENLLVLGRRDGEGVYQVWEDATPGLPDALVQIVDLQLTGVGRPTGLVPGGTEPNSLLVWDAENSSLSALHDLNLDNLPDTWDSAERSALGALDGERRLVGFEGGFFGLERVAAAGFDSGDMVFVDDADSDGFFGSDEVAHVGSGLDLPDREPCFASKPVAGAAEVVAAGAEGHLLELWMSDGNGTPLVPIAAAQFVIDGVVTFAVASGLSPGHVVILDSTNGTTSGDQVVCPVGTSTLDGVVDNLSPGEGGAFVWQRGSNLGLLDIARILVDGVEAPMFFVLPEGIFYETPANVPVPGDGVTDRGLVVAVDIIHRDDDGAERTLEAQPVAYDNPLLTDEYECRKGNIDAATGTPADVVLLNGWTGYGNSRRMRIHPDDAFDLAVAGPPSNADGPARFAMYAWLGEPSASSVNVLPFDVGMMCRRSPLTGGPGLPKKIANNTGKSALGSENWPGPPTQPAPVSLLLLPGGLGKTGTFTLQGIMVDPAAPNGIAGVTNAIVVESAL